MKAASHFRPERLPAPPKTFWGRELGRLRPAGRDRVTASCVFHRSKSGRSFGVDLAKGLWFCHGCGFGGDMISFVRRRYQLSFPDALKYLGVEGEDSSSPLAAAEIRERRRKQQLERDRQEAKREDDRRRRLEARDWLHFFEHIYQESSNRLSQLRQAAAEAFAGESEGHWEVLALGVDTIRIADASYRQLAGLEP